ncbi:MAG: hypothetical protein ACD_19C00241G0003 [uncultured bacterium]|nr:MAG: hypothetical protein ACD_19C00241G0003 [uncultured bacterium]KKP80402.1 MAG: hypothetical protein UR81_C0030G0004 [Candidatus Levybacteria bacterium GW2011_GWB1_35_5]
MKRKDILVLLIPSFIIVILWVVFNVYHSYINSTIPTDVNMQILYINPDFDSKTIADLKKRQTVEPIYTISQQTQEDVAKEIEQIPTPTPTAADSNLSSPSAEESLGGEISQ